jgi:hypothetical protein
MMPPYIAFVIQPRLPSRATGPQMAGAARQRDLLRPARRQHEGGADDGERDHGAHGATVAIVRRTAQELPMRLTLLAVTLAAVLPAQNTANDVGLTLQYGTATTPIGVVVGQVCGPFTCTPFGQNTPTTANSLVRTFRIYGDANSLYVLAMSTAPTMVPCVSIPGIANALVLGSPTVVLSFGITGPYLPSPSIACQQGVATYTMTLPPVAPAVVPFTVQALTYSHATGGPALSVAVRGAAH